jgi:hypothetical protein
MGHMKLRPTKVAAPRDFTAGFTLKRVQPPGEEAAPVAEGPCLPHFDSWLVSTDPPTLTREILQDDGFQIIVESHPDNDTCDSCVEWATSVRWQLNTATPEIESAVAAEDCKGLIVTVAADPEGGTDVEQFMLLLEATVNGEPYGTAITFMPDLPQVPCFSTSGDGACYPGFGDDPDLCTYWGYPAAQDWTVQVSYTGPTTGGTFAWNPTEPQGPNSDVIITEGLDGLGRPQLTITHVNTNGGISWPEDSNYTVNTAPTIDGNPVDPAVCFFDVGTWGMQFIGV